MDEFGPAIRDSSTTYRFTHGNELKKHKEKVIMNPKICKSQGI